MGSAGEDNPPVVRKVGRCRGSGYQEWCQERVCIVGRVVGPITFSNVKKVTKWWVNGQQRG